MANKAFEGACLVLQRHILIRILDSTPHLVKNSYSVATLTGVT